MNNIFTHFISRRDEVDGNKRLAYAQWFIDAVPLSEFEGDERLFCEYIDFSSKLGVPLCEKYYRVWLDSELREILTATKIRVKGCETMSFDDPASFELMYKTTSAVMLDNFKVLMSYESNVDDFKVEISAYFTERRKERLTQCLAQTFEVLNDTNSADNAADFALDNISAVKDIYDVDKLEELEYAAGENINRDQMVFVTDCGLPAIDNDSKGIYTSQLFDIDAQTGAGKTRFALGTYVYRALTLYHKDVLFLALEQKEVEVEAMLVATHVFHMFNIQISDKMILTNSVPEELKSKVEAARFDLFKSGKYGKIVYKETELYVETFITKIRTLDKLLGPFDLICIDYMGLIESKPAEFRRELAEYEIIKTAYRQFKRYVRKTNKAGLSISQLNREGVAAGKADKEISPEMAHGGMAVFRNTDYNIAISFTETMRAQQKRRFSLPKVRSSAGFASFIADTRLGFCYFRQVVAKAV